MPKKTKKSLKKASGRARSAISLRSRILAGLQVPYKLSKPTKGDVRVAVAVDDDGEID